ncbi:MAG TPA: hypothetical protein VFF28_07110, partial [Candidatus Nanoarchaeia archaeon]|nr:hypothetical protein [Candidatus Nanoarchaeia archaeon]
PITPCAVAKDGKFGLAIKYNGDLIDPFDGYKINPEEFSVYEMGSSGLELMGYNLLAAHLIRKATSYEGMDNAQTKRYATYAHRAVQAGLKVDQNFPLLCAQNGILMCKRGDFKGALPELLKTIKFIDSGDIRTAMGDCYRDSKSYDQARTNYEMAIGMRRRGGGPQMKELVNNIERSIAELPKN